MSRDQISCLVHDPCLEIKFLDLHLFFYFSSLVYGFFTENFFMVKKMLKKPIYLFFLLRNKIIRPTAKLELNN